MTNAQDKIEKHFTSIITRSGYNYDGANNLDTQDPEVAIKLGKLFYDYLVGSIYDTSWEGFSYQEQKAIAELLSDMDEAQRAGL